MRYLLLLIPLLGGSCVTMESMDDLPAGQTEVVSLDDGGQDREKNRALINRQVRELAQNLVAQPVMTPRSGFSGYLAHFQVIRTTTQDSPFAVIVDGEGYTADNTPPELQDFADLKGAHPDGGTYAFSSSDINGRGKDRGDSGARLILELPGPEGDGLMAIGFADGHVMTTKTPPREFDDRRIQSILSQRGEE